MLKITVDKEDGQLVTEPTKDGSRYSQFCWVHTGDKFPMKVKLNLQSPSMQYAAGEYKLAPSAFRTDKYGGLELNPFGIKLEK